MIDGPSPEFVVGNRALLEATLGVEFEAAGRNAIAARGKFVVALSGGSVTTFYPALARLGFDWSRTEFFWADERAVPPTDPESNYGISYRLWLAPARVPPTNIHRMRAEGADLAKAASDYQEEILVATGIPPTLDFALLGV